MGIFGKKKENKNPFRSISAVGNYNAGIMHLNGKGMPKNSIEAIRYFVLSASENYPQSQYVLGTIYLYGQGVPIDYVEAKKWFELLISNEYATLFAASVTSVKENILAKAQFLLGEIYRYGLAGKEDLSKATNLYELAINQGFEIARQALNGENTLKLIYETQQVFSSKNDY